MRASMWARYFSNARRPAGVRRYSVRGSRASKLFSTAMYCASSSLPSVVCSRRLRSVNVRRSLTDSADDAQPKAFVDQAIEAERAGLRARSSGLAARDSGLAAR
jgi:hypothetical protein